MYRCRVCKRRSESKTAAPCVDDSHQYDPEFIQTIHKYNYDEAKRPTVLCTGKPPKTGMLGLGGNYGINCIRCRTKMKEDLSSPG